MINLRYHVVSITAVFLALALGLTLGSTFLDRATVDALNGQLQGLENDLDSNRDELTAARDALSTQQAESTAFAEQGLGPLLDGELTGVPVMVFVASGSNSGFVERSLSSLSVAGADVRGIWTATDRFALDDEAERRDLAAIVGIDTDLETRLRRTVAQRLANILLDRMQPVAAAAGTEADPAATPADDTVPVDDTVPADPATPEASEPNEGDAAGEESDDPAAPPGREPLVDGLLTSGFLVFQPIGEASDGPTLPTEGVRLVIIADPGSDLLPAHFVIPLIENLTVDGPASVVLASGLLDEADPATRGETVDLVRSDEGLSGVISTVDDLDSFEGWAALVLAVEGVSDGQLSHYGKAASASRLLPAPDGPA